MTDITTYVFDPTATDDESIGTTHRYARAINDSASVLNDICNSASSGYCCLAAVDMVPSGDELASAKDQMQQAAASIGVIPGNSHPDLTFIWQRLPSGLAGFVVPPESRGAVVINTARLKKSPAQFQTVDWPLQELVIRSALQDDQSVILTCADSNQTVSPLPAASSELPALAPGYPGNERRWMSQFLSQLSPQKFFNADGDDCENEAILSGLLQLNDYLDDSHNHSQSIQGQGTDVNGDYWHGIMHRREPDYGNAGYWFRRVGTHPCFAHLPAIATQALNECSSSDSDHWSSQLAGPSGWDAGRFIDLCETAEQSSDDELTTAAQRIQWAEMLLLLEHSYRQAAGL